MPRPSIALAVIAKNEEKNVKRFLDSVEGCFDQIVFVDTGSTDKTVEIASQMGCEIHHFAWVNDFSAARNFAFSKVTSDFVCWFDLDDVLSDKAAFKQWRDYAMEFGDIWFANYHYAFDGRGMPACTFLRERVMRKSLNPTWRYFVHEGINIDPKWSQDMVFTWSVDHMRTEEDHKQDKGRNLALLEANKLNLDSRMRWYLGKEYYDNQKFDMALAILTDVVTKEDLEHHDRILALQFAAYAAMAVANQMKPEFAKDKFMLAQLLAEQGLRLDPKRAEFFCIIGESHINRGDLLSALPYYSAAENCVQPRAMSPIFNFKTCYEDLPKIQKAKIYMNTGQIDLAEAEAKMCFEKYDTPEAAKMLEELKNIRPLVTIGGPKIKVDDIVFTCPPQGAYEFDEELYKTKGMGGSETALIEMAVRLKKLTGRRVIVFNVRDRDFVGESGVEWVSNQRLNHYMSEYDPHLHIAWRHNIKVTNAPTYLWCHDLVTATVEAQHNFDKIMCLTDFHKNYVMAKQGVPAQKIIVTRNGLNPDKFKFERKPKNPNKLVWMSSPDRGLERSILVCDELRKTHSEIELHIYYGFDNMYKYGLGVQADQLKAMIKLRPWVKYHGFTEQNKMYEQVSDAVVWLHPCNFIETFCITAIEMLSLGIFPVTRRLGALANTLAEAEKEGCAIMLDGDCVGDEQIKRYADATHYVLETKAWERIKTDPEQFSWGSVASEWVEFMSLEKTSGAKAV